LGFYGSTIDKKIGDLWKANVTRIDGSKQWVIEAFLSRKESNERLKSYRDGQFLIRFSETRNGCMVISYTYLGEVRHTLLTKKDVLEDKITCGDLEQVLEYLHDNIPMSKIFTSRERVPYFILNNFRVSNI